MNIVNYTLRDFASQSRELIDEYLNVLRYLKAIDTINEIITMKLRDVETIKQNIGSQTDEDLIEIISLVQGIEHQEVIEMPIITFFGLIASVRKQMERIAAAEEKLRPDRVDFKYEAVGGSDRMAKFGIFNTLEYLSSGDVSKYNYILDMPYSEIFTILLLKKTAGDIDHEMNLIK